jgi:hypothetical protein
MSQSEFVTNKQTNTARATVGGLTLHKVLKNTTNHLFLA